MSEVTLAALQIGSDPSGKERTLSKILSFEKEIRESGASLVVLPEALLGGYPKGENFGTRLGYRLASGREAFAQYFENAIDLDGPETDALTRLSRTTGATLVVGVIERSGSSLFCTALFFDPDQGLIAKHRKLMPTGTERLIWSQGDGSTMPVVPSRAGKLAAAICWENQMPMFRMAMYAKGVDIWCAPTVDERETWQCSMRHIAHEGRCFVVSACQVQPSPLELGIEVEGWPVERPLIAGGSLIVDPLGNVVAGPVTSREALITATVDLSTIIGARYDLDVAGHYARPDIFKLLVDESSREPVVAWEKDRGWPPPVSEKD